MLQRIQTIYLSLAAICLGLTYAFPFAKYLVGDVEVEFSVYGVANSATDLGVFFPYYVVVGIGALMPIWAITQYKKRKNQMKIGRMNYLVLLVTLTFMYIDLEKCTSALGLTEESVEYGASMFLPAVALLFMFLANRSIKKDEALVKSLDRLR